jgi:hypothetical protein
MKHKKKLKTKVKLQISNPCNDATKVQTDTAMEMPADFKYRLFEGTGETPQGIMFETVNLYKVTPAVCGAGITYASTYNGAPVTTTSSPVFIKE